MHAMSLCPVIPNNKNTAIRFWILPFIQAIHKINLTNQFLHWLKKCSVDLRTQKSQQKSIP